VLREEINTALKDAMKAREEHGVSTLRLVNAALKNADLEAQGRGKNALSDEEILALLQKLIKQRQEAASSTTKRGGASCRSRARRDRDHQRLSSPADVGAEAKAAIAEAIKTAGATGIKDTGKVMAALKQSYAGRNRFWQASAG